LKRVRPQKSRMTITKHVFQRLKEAAPKLTILQISALANYHIETEAVILMQQEAAHLIRQSIDSDFHSLLVLLPHNCSSATDVGINVYQGLDRNIPRSQTRSKFSNIQGGPKGDRNLRNRRQRSIFSSSKFLYQFLCQFTIDKENK
jgi:hypothetical protein